MAIEAAGFECPHCKVQVAFEIDKESDDVEWVYAAWRNHTARECLQASEPGVEIRG